MKSVSAELGDYFRHRRGCGLSRRLYFRMFINLPVKVSGDKVGPCYSSQKLTDRLTIFGGGP
jgi:hypothetical protein